MKDTILDDYLFEKERIEFHCDEIIDTIRLHGDLVFKTEKGKKFKEKLIRNCNEIKNILDRKLEEFFKVDHDYKKFKHHYSTQEVIVHDLEKDPNDLPEDDEQVIIIYSIVKNCFEQKLATYNKSNNRFYVDESTYIDTDTKLVNAWYKPINYKEMKNDK
jgi:hypothetical protein